MNKNNKQFNDNYRYMDGNYQCGEECENCQDYDGNEYDDCQQDYIQEDELCELVSPDFNLPPIMLNTENLVDMQYDEDAFMLGVYEGSKIAGYITALRNAGVSESFILQLISNRDILKNNLKITESNNHASIEMSKNQKVLIQNEEL